MGVPGRSDESCGRRFTRATLTAVAIGLIGFTLGACGAGELPQATPSITGQSSTPVVSTSTPALLKSDKATPVLSSSPPTSATGSTPVNTESLTLDVQSGGSTVVAHPGTIVNVRLSGIEYSWTKPVSSDNSVVSTLDASVGTDGGAAGRFVVVNAGTASLTAEAPCRPATPGGAHCFSGLLWRVTIEVVP